MTQIKLWQSLCEKATDALRITVCVCVGVSVRGYCITTEGSETALINVELTTHRSKSQCSYIVIKHTSTCGKNMKGCAL